MCSVYLKRTILVSIMLIVVCVAILSAGFHFSKKLCIKDRSYLCSAYSLEMYSDGGTDMAPDPVQEKTCGACHPKQVREFRKTAMGHNAKQMLYRTWTDKKMGPHNCGVWFVDGYDEIAKNTKVPFTKEMSAINQKACNICHVGCLDCHYAPKKKDHSDPTLEFAGFSKGDFARGT